MTHTRPATFEDHHQRDAVENFFVVKLVKGASTWLLGDRDMDLTEGHVSPLLMSTPRIQQSVNTFTRNWSIGSVRIILNNRRYHRTLSGKQWSLSEEGLLSGDTITAYIYVGSGPSVTGLSDMMKIGEGKVIGEPYANAERLVLHVEDIGAELMRRQLPMTVAQDTGMTKVGALDRLPIVLGNWDGSSPFGGLGKMVKCRTFMSGGGTVLNVVPADHKIEEVTQLWLFLEEGNLWLQLDLNYMGPVASTWNGSDGVDRTILSFLNVDTYDARGWLFVPPRNVYGDAWGATTWDYADYNDGRNNIKSFERAMDGYPETYATLLQGNVAGKGIIGFEWINTVDHAGQVSVRFPWRKFFRGKYSKDKRNHQVTFRDGYIDVSRWTMSSADTRLYFNITANPDVTLLYKPVGEPPNQWRSNVVSRIVNYYYVEGQSGMFDGTNRWIDLASLAHPFQSNIGWNMQTNNFRVHVTAHASPTPDPDDWLIRVNQICLRLYTTLDVPLTANSQLYAVVKGLTPSAAVVAHGSPLVATDTHIKYPSYQVEELLLKLGLTIGQFDTDSIDAIYGWETRAIIDDDNPITVGEFIQGLAENSDMVPFVNIAGKVRMMDIEQAPPGSCDMIRFDDLLELPTVFISSLNDIVNRIEYEYDYAPGEDDFLQGGIREDSTSQTSHGVKDGAVELRYVVPTFASSLSSLLVGTSGWLSNRHNGVRFATKALRWAHKEIGDWVQFESERLDEHSWFIAGASWSGQKFRIVGKEYDAKGINFIGIQNV
jgi:hypothetical protein